jgi:hypothetical protein
MILRTTLKILIQTQILQQAALPETLTQMAGNDALKLLSSDAVCLARSMTD